MLLRPPPHRLLARTSSPAPAEEQQQEAQQQAQAQQAVRVFLLDLGAPDGALRIMRLLRPVLEDPAKVKVLHGGGNDLQGLRSQFGVQLAGHIDTQVGMLCALLLGA